MFMFVLTPVQWILVNMYICGSVRKCDQYPNFWPDTFSDLWVRCWQFAWDGFAPEGTLLALNWDICKRKEKQKGKGDGWDANCWYGLTIYKRSNRDYTLQRHQKYFFVHTGCFFFDWFALKMTKFEEELKYLKWSANCSSWKVQPPVNIYWKIKVFQLFLL